MITKSTMVVIFNLQNSHLLTLSLPTEEVFQANGQNRPVANPPVVNFDSQPREMVTPKPCEYVTFGFSFSILVFLPFLSLNLTVCQRYGILSVLAAVIRESSDKQLVLRIVKTLTLIYQPDRGAPKAGDVSADWLYQRT